MKKQICIIDYETHAIDKRPDYPPLPVGAAVDEPGHPPYYYAWGHPTSNNCTRTEAARIIKRVSKRYNCVYHNAKFDIEVSQKFFNVPLPPHDQYECTMLLAYLRNPREVDLKLKSLADRWLGMPPDEQARLRDWILDNVKGARASPTKWGQHIALAPGKLVGQYAIGDIVRTRKLYELFMPYINDKGMAMAYTVEKKITPIVIRKEQQGVPVDVKALKADLDQASRTQARAIKAVYRKLGKKINLGSRPQVVEAFEAAGLVEPGSWIRTEPTVLMCEKAHANGEQPVGHERIGIEHLMQVCTSKTVNHNMALNSKLNKLISTYMVPWLAQAEQHKRYYPWFNQIRGDDDHGTKSGRFSSNFQQTPKKPDTSKLGLLLPNMRNYVIGDSAKHIVLSRDFSSQELRILAYYEERDLYQAYLDNPNLDIHALVGSLIKTVSGIDLPRGVIKIINFMLVYGGGRPALASKLKISLSEADKMMKAHRRALPGVRVLMKSIDNIARHNQAMHTIAGREYYAEKGFEFRMLNTLMQGGGADHLKAAMIRIDDAFNSELEDTRILLTVHDEFLVSCPTKLKRKAMVVFREAMDNDDYFQPIPMTSEGKAGKTWGSAKDYEPK